MLAVFAVGLCFCMMSFHGFFKLLVNTDPVDLVRRFVTCHCTRFHVVYYEHETSNLNIAWTPVYCVKNFFKLLFSEGVSLFGL